MKEISEGETTLLDNSILVATSSLFDGDAHSADRLPFLITGKGGGTIKGGRVLDYMDKGDEGRKACSLHLSLMDRMGVHPIFIERPVKTAYCLPPTAYRLPLTAYRLPPTAYRLPLTAYRAVHPPSTNRQAPVMNEAASEARKTAGPAISSSSPQRPSGIWVMNCL